MARGDTNGRCHGKLAWPTGAEPDWVQHRQRHHRLDLHGDLEGPKASATFERWDERFQSPPGLSISYAIDGYEWGSLRRDNDGTSIIVDIGGSHGQISIGIAKKYSFIHCIVQDLPEVLEHSSIPTELQTRVKLMGHDFFQEQTVKGVAAYFLRWIVHDWPDTFAVKILKALVPAFRPGSKVILNELCMPAVGTISVCQERYLR